MHAIYDEKAARRALECLCARMRARQRHLLAKARPSVGRAHATRDEDLVELVATPQEKEQSKHHGKRADDEEHDARSKNAAIKEPQGQAPGAEAELGELQVVFEPCAPLAKFEDYLRASGQAQRPRR